MSPVRRAAVVLILLLLVANGVALAWRPAPPAKFVGVSASTLPERIGSYRSQGDMPMPDDVRQALASATLIARSYAPDARTASATAAPIDFILIGGTDRSALHDPRSCLVGDGWKIEQDRSETLPGAAGVPVRACRIVKDARGDEPAAAYDMLYLYVVDGRVVEHVTDIRARMLAAALLGHKSSPTYFLRFVSPAPAGDVAAGTEASENAAAQAPTEESLRQFARTMWEEVGPKLTASPTTASR